LTEFISHYGVWLVAGFIALETIGLPFPAEAALMAAAVYAGTTHGLDIWLLIPAGIAAAILGNIVGFWIGRRFGNHLLLQYGPGIGLNEGRIKIGQWLFLRHGGKFVFAARFLPFLRNMAALLAGANEMPQHKFLFSGTVAAVIWVVGYVVGAYSLGHAFTRVATPAAIVLGFIAAAIVLAVPMLVLRYEKRLLERAELELPRSSAAKASTDVASQQ
jgi:membrane protein DedA with SNARE-associated domain